MALSRPRGCRSGAQKSAVPSPGRWPRQTCCSALLIDLEKKKSLMLFFFFPPLPVGCCVAEETSAPGVLFPFLPAALTERADLLLKISEFKQLLFRNVQARQHGRTRLCMRKQSRLPWGKPCWGNGLSADNEPPAVAWAFEASHLQACRTQRAADKVCVP